MRRFPACYPGSLAIGGRKTQSIAQIAGTRRREDSSNAPRPTRRALAMSLQNTAAKADDDLDLARRIGARDERAFETVMRAHNRMLYRLARSILRDDADAEDAVQDA